MYDLIVLGGGPAGLTATMYALQKRLNVLMVTRDLGGKTIHKLQLPFFERHMAINGDEVIERFKREIDYLDHIHELKNAEHIETTDDGYEVTVSGGDVHQTRALIVATGAKGQLLDVPGEHEFRMRGLCYSALSYAHLFIDRTAVVVGDGDLALKAVAELARNAYHVTLIAGENAAFNTHLELRLKAAANVELLEGCEIVCIKGNTYARSIVINSPNGEREIFFDGLFVEKELMPRSDLVAHLVTLDAKGHIKINSRNETSAPGLFAAGDVTDTFSEQVLISIGEGAKAALSAYEYLIMQEHAVKAMA